MHSKVIPYNPKLKPIAKTLRKRMTLAEVKLWNQLKQKQMMGYDFDRQKPLDEYIVDFYCKSLMLAIEVDGVTHDNEKAQLYDANRQTRLELLGVHFLRFQNRDIETNLQGVIDVIRQWISENQ